MHATVTAHPNIALVKYWGKRDRALNLPAAGSLSLTLGPVGSRTSLRWGAEQDRVSLDGRWLHEAEVAPFTRFLDLVRARAQRVGAAPLGGAEVVSENDFPTAAGLASSSSGFAALAVAAAKAAGVAMSPAELSELARRGSGSAARSVFGGFVRMRAGERADGTDAVAEPVFDADHWPLSMLLGVTVEGPKDVSSRDGMNRTQETSPYFGPWVETVEPAVEAAIAAIAARDFERLAEVAEASALAMHASAIAAVPGVLYWRGATVEAVHAVRSWRAAGIPAFFTIDAGPHVKVCVPREDEERVAEMLRDVPGVSRVIVTRPAGAPVVHG